MNVHMYKILIYDDMYICIYMYRYTMRMHMLDATIARAFPLGNSAVPMLIQRGFPSQLMKRHASHICLYKST